MSLLVCENIVKEFGSEENRIAVLKGVSLSLEKGEAATILGSSGAGKSTLLNIIGALDPPSSGKVYLDGEDIYALNDRKISALRNRKLGFVFQLYQLMAELTALENVTLPMIFAGMSSDDAREKAAKILTKVGLGKRLFHRPFELSGGQQQRVAVARAIANDPVIILADEPTANLDVQTGKEMIELLKELKESDGVTVIAATHDMKMLDASDRILWIRDGKVDRLEKRENVDIKVGHIAGDHV